MIILPKKREIYNSIIVDNNKHKKIETINSKEKDDVVEILKIECVLNSV